LNRRDLLSSSYFPYYLKNLTTGTDDVGLKIRSVVAKQKIYQNSQFSLHFTLPIISKR
jgi:predicted acyl esterase